MRPQAVASSSTRPAAACSPLAPQLTPPPQRPCRRTSVVTRAQAPPAGDAPSSSLRARRTAAASAAPAAAAAAAPTAAEHHHHRDAFGADDIASASGSASTSGGGGCPFLASLQQPPLVTVPWWRRLQQLTAPSSFQGELAAGAGGHALVRTPWQIGMVGFTAVFDPELAKQVFAGEATGETSQSDLPSFTQLMGDESLVVVKEPTHRMLRAIMQPAFAPEAVASYVRPIQELVQRHLARWEAASSSSSSSDSSSSDSSDSSGGSGGVRGYDAIKRVTFDFILSITLGRQYSEAEIDALQLDYAVWTSGFLAWPWLDLPLTPFGRAMRAKERLIAHFQAALDGARAAHARGERVAGVIGDLVAATDDRGQSLTDKQINENILLLLLAGHDTSSTTLTRAIALLHEHPAAVERLRAEQRAVRAKHGDALTAAALREMPYAEAVLRETLRRDPVVAGLFRTAAKDLDLGGYAVPAGTPLLLPLRHLAVTDARWPDAAAEERFEPERFLTPEGLKPGAQMPFGSGPRFCLGYYLSICEMKVLLGELVHRYDFAADTETEWAQAVGRVPKNGLPLRLTPRAAAAPVAEAVVA